MTQRVAFVVYVDLDDTPGEFHSQESAQNAIRVILHDRISHYNPIVSLAPLTLQPNADLKKLLGGFPTPPLEEDTESETLPAYAKSDVDFMKFWQEPEQQKVRVMRLEEVIPNEELPRRIPGWFVQGLKSFSCRKIVDGKPCFLMPNHDQGPFATPCRSLRVPNPEIHAANFPTTCLYYRWAECSGDVSMVENPNDEAGFPVEGSRVPMCEKHATQNKKLGEGRG